MGRTMDSMLCDEVRHIIDQVFDRELPREVLDSLSDHLENCKSCREYLDENLKLHGAINLFTPEEINSEFYAELGDELKNCKVEISLWENVVSNPHTRILVTVAAIFIIAIISGFAIYHHGLFPGTSFSDKKFEAMMKKLPEGAVLMRGTNGEETIFLDPAIDADRTDEALMREYNAAMHTDITRSDEDLTFASAK
jgi:hypothetical protein